MHRKRVGPENLLGKRERRIDPFELVACGSRIRRWAAEEQHDRSDQIESLDRPSTIDAAPLPLALARAAAMSAPCALNVPSPSNVPVIVSGEPPNAAILRDVQSL